MRAFVLAASLWMLALPLWADARSTVLVDVLRLGELAEILGIPEPTVRNRIARARAQVRRHLEGAQE